MLMQFGGQPQPVRRLHRAKSLGPPITRPINQAPPKAETDDDAMLPYPRSPQHVPFRKPGPTPLPPTDWLLADMDTDFTFCTQYNLDYNKGKAEQLRNQSVVLPIAGVTSNTSNVVRTRRCRSMTPRDTLQNLNMTVIGARKPEDHKSIEAHSGYYGEDGEWRSRSTRRRNEAVFSKLHERHHFVQEILQPLASIENIQRDKTESRQRLLGGQRFCNSKLEEQGSGKFIYGNEPPEFKPLRRMQLRFRSVPPPLTGPERRILDYGHDDGCGDQAHQSRSGRRPLHPKVSDVVAHPFDQHRKAPVPTRHHDHHDLLVWHDDARLRPGTRDSSGEFAAQRAQFLSPSADVEQFLSCRERATLRRLEQLQRMEAASQDLHHLTSATRGHGNDVSKDVSDRISELRGRSRQRAVRDGAAIAPDDISHAPLAAAPSHGGRAESLRGRRVGYPQSHQSDSDPILGLRLVTSGVDVDTASQPSLRTVGYHHLSHHLDHDPILQRSAAAVSFDTGSVRSRRAKSAF